MSFISGVSTSRPRCLLEPIPEIYEAATYLKGAASALLSGRVQDADALVRAADIPRIRDWTEALWRSSQIWTVPSLIVGTGTIRISRTAQRMPDKATRQALIHRDTYHCRFCGIPVVRSEVRNRLRKFLPEALRWGSSNSTQHAALQAMWLQYDHLVPHSRGGDNSLENIAITCAPCNYARMNYTVDEVGLENPLLRTPAQSEWSGLEEIFSIPKRASSTRDADSQARNC
ncbi:HNH endonuclease [Hyphomicrobium sp. MC8b]|uniref:HNH endonuclease n=1 Tax=Hyphomicrobium sp. MC8b TaxID=300273 RepID=UPI00391C2B58